MAKPNRRVSPTAPELPADVRLTRWAAALLALLAAGLLLAGGVRWLLRAPWLPIRQVQVEGELQHNSAATLRAGALSQVQGNFLGLDLQQARAAFESTPWVRTAEVRRIWPGTLKVQVSEHRAVALWKAEDGNDRLVNSFGEVFDANVGDVEDDGLPSFSGPPGSAAQMLAVYRRLQPLAERLSAEVDELHLSARGSWRVELDNAARIELGRGTPDDVAQRLERFVRTLAQVQQAYPAPLAYADLRHPDGYAVKLKGFTTVAAAASAAAPAKR